MSDGPIQSPVNPIPPVVMVIALAIVLVEGIVSLGAAGILGGPGAIGWRINAINDFALTPRVWDLMWEVGAFDLAYRFVTYPFVHGSFTHTAFALVLLLALGKFVGDGLGGLAVAVVFATSTVLGGLAFVLLAPEQSILFGAYPAAYGLIGAFTWMLYVSYGRSGANQLQAFRLIGFLLALQLIFAVLFGPDTSWIGDLGGFVAGFAVAPLAAPGGWAALVDRMRQR